MSIDEARRAEAAESLRAVLRNAGHELYAAASTLARDSSIDTIARQIRTVDEVVTRLNDGVERLADAVELERKKT